MKSKLKRIMYLLFKIGGFTECAKCEYFETCDRKPWLHMEEDCNYRKVNNWKG